MTQRAIDGPYIYFVTTVVDQRRWFFITPDRAAHLGKVIQTACRLKHFDLLAYTIQPNHLHLLVKKMNGGQRTLEKVRHGNTTQFARAHNPTTWRGLSSPRRHTLSNLMQSIKGTYSRQIGSGQFWQPRSIFKIVDNEQYLSNLIHYIQNNYQKMNLKDAHGQLPYVYLDWEKIDQVW